MPLNKILIRQYGARNRKLKKYGYANYEDYLKSEEWREIKRKVESRGGHWKICEVCVSTEKIQLHHVRYSGIGKGNLNNLKPLCNSCHFKVHQITLKGKCGLKTAVRKLKKIHKRVKNLI